MRALILFVLVLLIPVHSWAAVARSGAVVSVQSTANASSQAVTVPADAVVAVVTVAGYQATANYFSAGSVTLGGSPLTVGRADDASTALDMSAAFYLVNPLAGSQTLAWNWAGTVAATLGVQFYVAFYTGVDTAAPIRSAGGQAISASAASSGTLSASAGDLALAIGHGGATGTTPTNITWTNATETNDLLFNTARAAYAEASPSGAVTITATQSGGSGTLFTNISALVLAQSVPAAADGRIILGRGLHASPSPLAMGGGVYVAP